MSASQTPILPTWQLFPNSQILAEHTATLILEAADKAIKEKSAFHLVLAGGTTPRVVYRLLANSGSDWQHWHIYLGDERCLPVEDPERNSQMAQETLLNHVSIPAEQVHFIPAELGAEAAAKQYSELLESAPAFDMVLLGMGEDGHTASLFPGQLHPKDTLAVPVFDAPKPPSDRVSLSSAALSNTHHLLILITGSGKHDRVLDWISGMDMPVKTITTINKAGVLCDHPAWLGPT